MRPIVLTKSEPALDGRMHSDSPVSFDSRIGIWIHPDGTPLVEKGRPLSTIKTATREAADQPDVGDSLSFSDREVLCQTTVITETREGADTSEAIDAFVATAQANRTLLEIRQFPVRFSLANPTH